MNRYVKGPDLISDMAAEDFSLPNSSDKMGLSWKRNRGRRGFVWMDNKKTTKYAIKEKFMRNSSGVACEPRTCKWRIATTMNARRGEKMPVIATVDQSGKVYNLRNIRKSGRGMHHIRPKSLQSGSRMKRRESNVPGGTVSDPLNLQVEDLPETPYIPEPDPKRYDRPANNFIPTNNRDPLGLTNEDDTVPLCTQYDPSGPKRKRSRGRKRDPSMSTDATTTSCQQAANEIPDNTTVPNSTDSINLSESTTQPEPSVIPGHEQTQSNPIAMEQDLKSSIESELSEPVKRASLVAESCEGGVRSSVDENAPDIKASSSGQTIHSLTGHTTAVPGTSGVNRPSKDKSEHHADRISGNEHHARDQRHKAHNRIQKYPVVKSPMDVKEKREVPKGRKSLMEALRIDKIDDEDLERLTQEHKKQQRDFRRKRFPNWKSPEEEEDQALATEQSALKPLKVDTDSAGNPIVQGQLSRTLDSIVSPKFQPHSGPIRKRRRTISDCSADAGVGPAKALTFRRSSSPDVGCNTTPSPKKRRLSFGSWSGKSKKKSEQEKAAPAVKFAKNPVFKNGNYYRYYGYRMPELEPDYRLSYFRMDWFEGKDVLDIGCNSGIVTLAIAQHFHPQKIVGMDIDPNLIRVARQNIKSYQTMANCNEMKKYPVSMAEYGPIEPLPALTNASNYFPKNIMFMQGNYVLDRDEQLNYVKQEYDTILALSVTKWVHLNSGDEGLKRMFARIFQQLRPGGRLILEPQAWVSYRRRKKLTETIYKNYNNIRLKPEHFSDYLLNQVGFCKREVIGVPAHPYKGFQRQLLLFTKFSDQSYTPPNLISPYPSGPRPPVYSIAERFASLAGYSSTPSLDTPGLNTPVLHPQGLQSGEVSCPFTQDGSCSSASLCSTCMSRASTGPHESDSDYAGYSAQGRPFSRRFPFESPGYPPCIHEIPDTPSPPARILRNPGYMGEVHRTPPDAEGSHVDPNYLHEVNGRLLYALPLNRTPGHHSSPDSVSPPVANAVYNPLPNAIANSPPVNGIGSPEDGPVNGEVPLDIDGPLSPDLYVPFDREEVDEPLVNGHLDPENDPGDLFDDQWQDDWVEQQHHDLEEAEEPYNAQEGEWPSPEDQDWPQQAGQLQSSSNHSSRQGSPLRSGHVNTEGTVQDSSFSQEHPKPTAVDSSQPGGLDSSPLAVQDNSSPVEHDSLRLNVHDTLEVRNVQDNSQSSHDRLQVAVDSELDQTVFSSSASNQDFSQVAAEESLELEAQDSVEVSKTEDDSVTQE